MGEARGRLAATIVALFFWAPLVCILAPRATVGVLAALAATVILQAFLDGIRPRALWRPSLLLVTLLATGAYLFINATWSLDPGRAAGKAAVFLLFAFLTIGAARALLEWPEARTRAAARGFVVGLGLGLAFLLIELVTDQAITRALFNNFPITRPDNFKGMELQDDWIVRIRLSDLDRGIAVLTLSLWAGMLSLRGAWGQRSTRLACLVLLLLASAAVYLSAHETSQVALAASLIVFAVAWFWPRLASLGTAAAWVLAFLAIVPAAIAAYQANLHEAEWLPHSARARVVLWAYTAEHVSETPLLGIGVESTREMASDPNALVKQKRAVKEGRVYAWWGGPHTHNEFLQTWSELGVVGVIFFMAAGGLVVARIARLPSETIPYMLAQFAAFAMISASAWGMWQTWLMAMAGLPVLFGALAVAAAWRDGITRSEP